VGLEFLYAAKNFTANIADEAYIHVLAAHMLEQAFGSFEVLRTKIT
jgi:hypothetical protein